MLISLLIALILAEFTMPVHRLHRALQSLRLGKGATRVRAEDECSAIAGDSLVCSCGSH